MYNSIITCESTAGLPNDRGQVGGVWGKFKSMNLCPGMCALLRSDTILAMIYLTAQSICLHQWHLTALLFCCRAALSRNVPLRLFTNTDSKPGTTIGCCSLWTGPGMVAKRRPVSYRDLKGAQRHYMGKLRKTQLNANVLGHSTYTTFQISNTCHPIRNQYFLWLKNHFSNANGTQIVCCIGTRMMKHSHELLYPQLVVSKYTWICVGTNRPAIWCLLYYCTVPGTEGNSD